MRMGTNLIMTEENEDCKLKSENIVSFFKDSTIFLTGVTGFLGHVLLSKLLSSCSDIRKIYILIREKKNREISERFQEILEAPIFEKLKTEHPHCLSKVAAIKGDCLKPNLGILENDLLTLKKEVNVIFHVAATVRFDAPLREAVNINVRSTCHLLNIAKNMTKLQAFVHVSTAFSFCVGRTVIEEKLYDPPIPAKHLLTIVDELNDPIIDRITSSLLDSYPNTYVFTKAVAENLFPSVSTEIPISIFRPAIVISTAKEPIPGWINNLYGPTGITAAAGIGLMRTLHIDKECRAYVVPCDYVINALIASAWFTAKRWQMLKNDPEKLHGPEGRNIPIFNYSGTENRKALTWKQFMYEIELFEPELPFSFSIWAYSLTLNKYKFMNQLYIIFLHLIPALVVDKVAVICGKKPKLWKSYQKLHKLMNVISYFSTRNWVIPNDNVQNLWNLLSERDKRIFYFNLDNLNWREYFRDHLLGIRLYIIKDKLETIPYAIKKRKKLILTNYIVLSMLSCLFAYFFYIILRLFF